MLLSQGYNRYTDYVSQVCFSCRHSDHSLDHILFRQETSESSNLIYWKSHCCNTAAFVASWIYHVATPADNMTKGKETCSSLILEKEERYREEVCRWKVIAVIITTVAVQLSHAYIAACLWIRPKSLPKLQQLMCRQLYICNNLISKS